MKKKSTAKTVKDEKMDKIKKLVKKENEANKKFKNFGGSVSLGKYAILDSSDDDDDRRVAPSSPKRRTIQEPAQVDNKATKSEARPQSARTTNKPRVKKDSKKSSMLSSQMTKSFIVGLTLGAGLLIARQFLL